MISQYMPSMLDMCFAFLDFCYFLFSSVLGWRPSLVGWLEAIASRVEANVGGNWYLDFLYRLSCLFLFFSSFFVLSGLDGDF